MPASAVDKEIAGYIGRLVRDSMGRGPKSVNVSLSGPFVVIYLRDLLSPMEEILLDEGQERTVVTTREVWMKRILPDIRAAIKLITHQDVVEVYYDWSLHNRSGTIVGVAAEPDAFGVASKESPYKDELLREVDMISQAVQKSPDSMSLYEIDSRTVVVTREGILVPIEKELLRLHHEVLLKYAKRELEKRHLHNDDRFDLIFQRKVVDIFADWLLESDKSVIVFKLNPSQ